MAETKREEFDPVAHGQATAKENSKGVRAAVEKNEKVLDGNIEEAQNLAKKNAKLDDKARGKAEMKPQDVGTAERDIPEGAPVTDEPESSSNNEKKAASKDADVKKDMPDDEKRQNTDKDSATPAPEATNSPKETPAVNKTADKK